MQFNLQSKITDHSININDLAERVIVGPQEEVLRYIEAFNFRFHSDIRCTKKFRWEPGFYKKLRTLQLNVMGFDKSSRTVRTSFSKVSNNDWVYRQLKQDTEKIDTMLYRLRSNNMMFQDNTEAVTESTSEWFNNIMSTTEVLNNDDNGYMFEVYHAKCSDMGKDYILFVITVDGYNMDIGTDNTYAPLKTGKVKMFIALDLIKIIGGTISGNDISFGREYQHSGYHIGGQYFPLEKGLKFPYISGGRGWSSRIIDFTETYSDYTRIDDFVGDGEPSRDGYTALCFGDLGNHILKPLCKGRLDEVVFWLNKWGGFYNINRTSPLNNYTRMYHGTPKALYSGHMEGILGSRSSESCEYTPWPTIIQSESYCDMYECIMRDTCRKYENAYAVVDDETLAMREQILANYMISRQIPFHVLEDPEECASRTESSLSTISQGWSTALSHWNDMIANINAYFEVNVGRESMLYVMASVSTQVNYGETINWMENHDMGEIGFYNWLDDCYPDRTITPELIPMENRDNDGESNHNMEMERQLLEHYSSTGRGIPIQIPNQGDLVDTPDDTIVLEDNPFN